RFPRNRRRDAAAATGQSEASALPSFRGRGDRQPDGLQQRGGGRRRRPARGVSRPPGGNRNRRREPRQEPEFDRRGGRLHRRHRRLLRSRRLPRRERLVAEYAGAAEPAERRGPARASRPARRPSSVGGAAGPAPAQGRAGSAAGATARSGGGGGRGRVRTRAGGRRGAESGGLSGRPIAPLATEVLADSYRSTEGRGPPSGVGGIASGADAYARIRAGASRVQLYTAVVFHGRGLIRRNKRDHAA